MDKCGRKVNEWESDYTPGLSVSLQPDGSLYRAGVSQNITFGGGTGGIIEKFDWDGNLKWTYTLADSNNVLHHDFKVMPNGHLLVIIWENHSIADAISHGRDSVKTLASIWSERIAEIEPEGKDSAVVIWEWRAWDHMIQDFDSTKLNYGVVSEHRELFDINFTNNNKLNWGQDWFHFNSIDYHEAYDQILLTAHSLDEIYVIDHSTSTSEAAAHSGGRQNKGGDILYRWGNPQAYKMGNASDRKLFKPHHAHWLINDQVNSANILIFNNGLDRPGSSYSTVNSIMPPVLPTGSYLFSNTQPFAPKSDNAEYKALKPSDFYSPIMGGAFQIGDRHFLITEATTGTFFEVLRDTIVWKYINPYSAGGSTSQGSSPGTNYVFRCQFYTPDFPGFDNRNLSPGDEIEDNPYPGKLCDPPPPPKYQIGQINRQAAGTGVGDSVGVRCEIHGVVQSANWLKNGIELVIADGTGSIRLTSEKNYQLNPKAGDSMMWIGEVMQENGWLSIGNTDTALLLGSMKPTRKPENNSILGEANESRLIVLRQMRIQNPAQWPVNPFSGKFVSINLLHPDNSTDSMRIYAGSDLNGTPVPQGYVDITGFVGQNDISKPYKSGYFLVPADRSNISASVLPELGFQSLSDTLSEKKTLVQLPLRTAGIDAVSFDVVAKTGSAILNNDYQFTAKHVQVTAGNPSPAVVVNYGISPVFEGMRTITFAIRNISGPAFLGNDSVITLNIAGKKDISTRTEKLQTELLVYPNPSADFIRISSDKSLKSAQLIDPTGKIVFITDLRGKSAVLHPEISNGWYLMNIEFEDGTHSVQKWMVEK